MKNLIEQAVRKSFTASPILSVDDSKDKDRSLPLIAVVQMCSTNDKHKNLMKMKLYAEDASRNGAELVCFPECCVYMGVSPADTVKNAEPLEGPSIQALRQLAQNLRVWINVGGFSCAEGENVQNVSVMIDPRGEIQSTYAKMHLFDNPLTGMQESLSTQAGNQVCSVGPAQGCFAKIGLTICYDVRFPELYGKLCRSEEDGNCGGHGAEIVLVPSAFMVRTGQAHWEILLRARAIENQVYIVAAAQVGNHHEDFTQGGGRISHGHSMIINPWGTVEARLGGHEEGVVLASFNRQLLIDIRKNMPCQAHRRPNLYM